MTCPIPYRRCAVTWYDATGLNGGWRAAGDAIKKGRLPAAVTTCGFLLHRDARTTVIAQSLSADGDVFHTFSIPSVFIRKVRFL